MPYSFGTFDQVIASLLQQIKPKKILDIGCGAGKYGDIARKSAPDAQRIGIEVCEEYVERFKLKNIYDEVRIGYANDVLNHSISENYDVVIIGDCIEHMPKSVGLDLLNFLTYRSQYIIVLAPEFVIQHESGGVAEEAHISVWSEHDLMWHDRWAWDNCWVISLFILRGYLQSSTPLNRIVDTINNSKIPLTSANSQTVVKDAELKLVYRERPNLNKEGRQINFRPL